MGDIEKVGPDVVAATSEPKNNSKNNSKNIDSSQVVNAVAEAGVRFVDLQFTDIAGATKSVTIPAGQLAGAFENGVWFDGSAIEGFARVAENDMYLVPDASTLAVLPWTSGASKTARLICWVYTPRGERYPGDPRNALDRVLKEAASLGFLYNTGPELEFFLFKGAFDEAGLPAMIENDRASYFDQSIDFGSIVRQQAVQALGDMGVDYESFHHEIAPGQHEVDLTVGPALRTADNVVTAKNAVRAVAQQNGLKATFMPKPLMNVPGSGMHTHQSLTMTGQASNGKGKIIPPPVSDNVFSSAGEQYGLSTVARHFIAGQLAHAKGMTAVLAPLVNSYKRLAAGYEAPVYISWARVNRGALVRVPHSGPGPGHKSAARLELRCPDASCNPYLAFAVMLKAGLDGIKRRLPLPEPIEESIFQFDATELRRRSIATLPSTLREAIEELRADEVIQEALGDHIYENFVEAKMEEWAEYRRQISPWEIQRYFDGS